MVATRESAVDTGLVSPVRPSWLPRAALGLGWLSLVAGSLDLAVNGFNGSEIWFVASALLMGSSMVVIRRQPEVRLGGWFATMAGILAVGFVLPSLLRWAVDASVSEQLLFMGVVAYGFVNVGATIAGLRVIVLFPDGRYLDHADRTVLRTTWLLLLVPVGLVVLASAWPLPAFIGADVVTNPLAAGWAPLGPGAVNPAFGLLNLMGLVGAGLLIRRYRRCGPPLRRSIRWLLIPVIIGTTFGVIALVLGASEALLGAAMLVFVCALGISITLGLLRPPGVDVDEAVRMSMVYGALVVTVACLYAATSALVVLTAGRDLSASSAVVFTAGAMLALQPARAWFERRTKRWLFGDPPDARAVLLRLGDWLEDTYDLETLPRQMSAALEEGLGLEWARVTVTPDRPPVTGQATAVLTVPIELDGDRVGLIECGAKRSGTFDDDDRVVVEGLASQAALAVHNARLRAVVEARNEELASSRRRLVQAHDAERRRIERNIHDGVQQDLVALIGQAGLVQRSVRRSAGCNDSRLVADVDELQIGLERVLREIRDLATGLHPSLLRDRGLLIAIEGLAARHPLPVVFHADGELRGVRLPSEVEGASYFVVAESLANSLKHAGADSNTIELTRSGRRIEVRVSDDGRGFDADRPLGQGLTNLAERVAALGGEFRVDSEPASGTTTEAIFTVDACSRLS